MPRKKMPHTALFIILGLTLACAAPVLATPQAVQKVQEQPTITATATLITTPMPTPTTVPTAVSSPTQATLIVLSATPASFPRVTFERNTNCRRGPALNYFQATYFLKDHTTIAKGRNGDSSWLWVNSAVNPSEQCWVSIANLKADADYDYLPVVEFPTLPQAPTQLFVEQKSCGARNIVTLQWSGTSGETGFHFYRNGIMLSLLKTDASRYTDYPPRANEYIYEVESINNYGVSVRTAITVMGCKK